MRPTALATLVLAAGLVLVVPPSAATELTATDAASYRAALVTLSADTSTPTHVLRIGADFAMDDGPDPTYSGSADLVILGQGHTVTGPPGDGRFVRSGPASLLTIRNLTLTGFDSQGPGAAVRAFGSLRIIDSTLVDNVNHGTDGGGAVHANGDVDVLRSTFEQNTGSLAFGAGTRGGAVFAGHGLRASDSIFRQNVAHAGGGALYSSGAILVERSVFEANRAPSSFGGAVDGGRPGITVVDSRFTGNEATVGGGAIGNDARIVRSTFEGNRASSGGAVYGNATVIGSSFVGNRAGAGGAIRGGRVSVANSTFVGNVAGSRGGAFTTDAGVLDLNYVTMTRNSAPRGAHLAMRQNGLRTNHVLFSAPRGGGENCTGVAAGSSDFTFDSDRSCLRPGGTGNRSGGGPLVGPLTRGPQGTLFAEPLAGSPIVNAIPVAACGGLTTDQRGQHRPRGPGCDIGAVERS